MSHRLGKIFQKKKKISSNISDKEFLSRIFKELSKVNNFFLKDPIFKKWTKNLYRCFNKEHICISNKHMKKDILHL